MSERENIPAHQWSPSALSDVLDECREKYAHSRLWNTPRSRVTLRTPFGSAIHSAAEEGEKRGWWADEADALDTYVNYFRIDFDERLDDIDPEVEVKVGGKPTKLWPEGDTAERFRLEIGPKYLANLISLRRDIASEGWEIMGVEATATAEAHGEMMLGYLDLLANDGGEPVVVDYKAGGTVLGLKETQLLSYCWALDQRGIPARRAEFWWLNGASPTTQRIVYEFTDAQVAMVPQRIEAAISVREAGIWFPSPSRLCPSCSYQKDCSYWQPGKAATGATGGKGASAMDGEAEARTPTPTTLDSPEAVT